MHHGISVGDEAVDEAVTAAGHHTIPVSAAGLVGAAARRRLRARGGARREGGRSDAGQGGGAHARRSGAGVGSPRLRGLEAALSDRVLGQPEAVSAVARRMRVTKLQLDRKPQRPDGVFLFLGPSGVGKTELAKALAQVLYGDFESPGAARHERVHGAARVLEDDRLAARLSRLRRRGAPHRRGGQARPLRDPVRRGGEGAPQLPAPVPAALRRGRAHRRQGQARRLLAVRDRDDLEPRARAVGRREPAARLRQGAVAGRAERQARARLPAEDAAVGVRQPHRRPRALPQLPARRSAARSRAR